MSTSKVYFAFSKGLEKLCIDEIHHKAKLLEIKIENQLAVAGGCYFNIELNSLRLLLPYIKLSNSCNLVLDQFKCRDLPKLYNKAVKLAWGKYLLNSDFKVTAHCKQSRLNHEKKVAACLNDAITDHFKKQAPKKRNEKYAHEVIVYINNDECLLQINLAGEHLHFRTQKKNHKAPLRETYAAAMFYLATNHNKNINNIFDPMCGSGSLLLEAANFYKPSKRNFAINQLHNLIYLAKLKPNKEFSDFTPLLKANDINKEAITFCKENLKDIKNVEFSSIDFIDSNTNVNTTEQEIDLVLSNPPYGERIPWPTKNYKALASQLNIVQAKSICLILPKDKMRIIEKELCYTKSEEIEFRNGGLAVTICYFTKKST